VTFSAGARNCRNAITAPDGVHHCSFQPRAQRLMWLLCHTVLPCIHYRRVVKPATFLCQTRAIPLDHVLTYLRGKVEPCRGAGDRLMAGNNKKLQRSAVLANQDERAYTETVGLTVSRQPISVITQYSAAVMLASWRLEAVCQSSVITANRN